MTAAGSYRCKKGLWITVMAGLAFVSVGLAAPAQAGVNQDRDLYRLLTDPDQDHALAISNFAPKGPYPFDTANSISAAAGTSDCPWHGVGLDAPGWLNTPTPVSWRPVYPPLAWYPGSPAWYPPPGSGANF